MKDLRIVFDQSASVNVIHEIKSWNYNRNTTNLQQTLLSLGTIFFTIKYILFYNSFLSVAD